MDYQGRVNKLRAKLGAAHVDAVLITNLTNVSYLTGFTGSNGQLLVTASNATFMSDPRYAARAADIVEGAEIAIYKSRVTDVLIDLLSGVEHLGFEARHVTVAAYDAFEQRLDGTRLAPTKNLVEDLRRSKEPEEIAALERAIALSDDAFSWALDRIAVGMTERELALELEIRMRSAGAEAAAFDPIVASGPLSAHIHHSPSERAFEAGDLVLMDFGARCDNYLSDLTRTIVLGPPSEDQKSLYELVLATQATGIEAVAPDASTIEVDAIARAVVEEHGHGPEFGHPLGHGVGLDIHEAPRLGKSAEEELEVPSLVAGDVLTIEPGVYVVGSGGIRIEDCVLVTPTGRRVLGSAPKDELISL
jgi:Xaa-Pro aminopeptidase